MASERKDAAPTEDGPTLTIAHDKVCFIIIKAQEFDAKDVVTEPDTGSNPTDDMMISVLEDHGDDSVQEELTSFISDLSDDEQIDLVALAWLGRGDYTLEDWPTVREEAARAHAEHGEHTARYLLGMPLVGSYLEEGLSLFGYSCGAFEINGR